MKYFILIINDLLLNYYNIYEYLIYYNFKVFNDYLYYIN